MPVDMFGMISHRLASEIIASGEQWLTELSTTQLRDLLTMRPDAVGETE